MFVNTFEEFTDELLEQELYQFDHTIIILVQFFQPHLTPLMKFFTFFGSIEAIFICLILASAFLLWKKKHWETIFLTIGIAGGGLFNSLLKWIFRRQRPEVHRIIEETGYSFPSGHSMGSFIFYGMLCMILLVFMQTTKKKFILLLCTIFLVAMVGISRIYLGVHYPSDVIAGFAAGGAWITLCLAAMKLTLHKKQEHLRKHPV
jgi:membrane-associated phospholipid phosphatase